MIPGPVVTGVGELSSELGNGNDVPIRFDQTSARVDSRTGDRIWASGSTVAKGGRLSPMRPLFPFLTRARAVGPSPQKKTPLARWKQKQTLFQNHHFEKLYLFVFPADEVCERLNLPQQFRHCFVGRLVECVGDTLEYKGNFWRSPVSKSNLLAPSL